MHANQIASPMPYILSFLIDALAQISTKLRLFKFLLIFRQYDVIDYIITSMVYMRNYIARLHLHIH